MGGLKVPMVLSKDSNAQDEVLAYLTKDYLTVKQIAQRRGISRQAVYKIINKLRKKGLIGKGSLKGKGGVVIPTPGGLSSAKWRLHGQQFVLKVLWSTDSYDSLRSRRNLLVVDGNVVKVHREAVEVYCSPSRFFWGSSPDEADGLSWAYWVGFFHVLEQRLRVILLKEGSDSVRVVAAHYAEVGCEIARDYVRRGEPLKVYALEDGKLAFLVDQSHGRVEFEALHPVSGGRDAGSVHQFLEGLRAVEGFTPQFMLSSLAHIGASIEEILELVRK